MIVLRFLSLISLFLSSSLLYAQKDTVRVETQKKIMLQIDTIRVGKNPNAIEKTYIITTDSTNGNVEKKVQVLVNGEPLNVKADTIKVGKTTIITRTEKQDGKMGKKVEVTVDGKDLGEIIEKQIEIFSDKDNKPFKMEVGPGKENKLFKEIEGFKAFKLPAKKELKNIENAWWVLDLGFSQYNDQSNYSVARNLGFVTPIIGKDQLKLNTAASRNVNLWIVLQRLNLVQHKLNLKYGLGLELNNYRFEQSAVTIQKNPTTISLQPFNEVSKAKLAADYLTVPMMLNFNSSPEKSNGLRLSAGVSAGFLYSARFKTKQSGDIQKIKNDFDLEPFKFSWVGEIGVGPITLYGSFAMNNMWSRALTMKPYNVGFRIGGRPDRAKEKASSKKTTSFRWHDTL